MFSAAQRRVRHTGAGSCWSAAGRSASHAACPGAVVDCSTTNCVLQLGHPLGGTWNAPHGDQVGSVAGCFGSQLASARRSTLATGQLPIFSRYPADHGQHAAALVGQCLSSTTGVTDTHALQWVYLTIIKRSKLPSPQTKPRPCQCNIP